jgi:hypothetical protein
MPALADLLKWLVLQLLLQDLRQAAEFCRAACSMNSLSGLHACMVPLQLLS